MVVIHEVGKTKPINMMAQGMEMVAIEDAKKENGILSGQVGDQKELIGSLEQKIKDLEAAMNITESEPIGGTLDEKSSIELDPVGSFTDKDELEAYGLTLGIDLNKTKTMDNMHKDLVEHVNK